MLPTRFYFEVYVSRPSIRTALQIRELLTMTSGLTADNPFAGTGGAGIEEDTAQEALKSYTFDPSKKECLSTFPRAIY